MTSRNSYRRHSTPFKLLLCQEIRAGVIGRRDAQRSHNRTNNTIRRAALQSVEAPRKLIKGAVALEKLQQLGWGW